MCQLLSTVIFIFARSRSEDDSTSQDNTLYFKPTRAHYKDFWTSDSKYGGPFTNSVLWNAMIHPLLNMTIYGAIWYQGRDTFCSIVMFYFIISSKLVGDGQNLKLVPTGKI